jgi:hypothetical protein
LKILSFSCVAAPARGLVFQDSCRETLSSDEDESVSASTFVNMPSAAVRKSRKVGALDLSNKASSSSGNLLEIDAGFTLAAIIWIWSPHSLFLLPSHA